jgi:cytochrome c oxidase subunit IV
MDHAADGHEPVVREEEAIQHPLGVYFKIWILLFVLSAMSYAVDYYQVQGYMRWFLILMFMVLKAGLIIAVFMHMVWERLALVYFILVPPNIVADFRCYWFIGSRLDVFSARRALFERVNHCRTGITASLKW